MAFVPERFDDSVIYKAP